MFPVGLLNSVASVSTPVVNGNKITGFFDGWMFYQSDFPVELSGFAVNIQILQKVKKIINPITTEIRSKNVRLDLSRKFKRCVYQVGLKSLKNYYGFKKTVTIIN